MKISGKEYKDFVFALTPKSKKLRNMLCAFIFGGAICCVGQALNDMYTALGLSGDTVGSAVTVTMIFLGALFTALGVYDKLAKLALAGSLVPVTGFANSVASPAIEARTEGLILGTACKLFTIAGPVIVWGTAASVVYGIVLLLI